jgi:hypothetical protein
LVDLGGAQRVFEWGWFRITYANLAVLGLMAVVLVAAILFPFPKGRPAEPDREPVVDDPGGGWTGSVRRWARRQLPWSRLLPSSEPSYVASWTYTFGVATLASLAVVIVSGIVLAAGGPGWRHTSDAGRFVDDCHLWSVQLMFFFMILHLVAQFLQASWRGRRGLTWVMGSVAMLGSIAAALTGYVSQQNFEAQWIATQAKDGLNAVGVGGFVNLLDTQQVLTLHVIVLPLTVAVVVAIHLLLVRRRGVCPPIGDESTTVTSVMTRAGSA